MEFVEFVREARLAVEQGDYRLATAACTHALETYPTCLSAHRMLAEAYLEQGHTAPAVHHFERALAADPRNVVARLGLGVAAEEQQDPRAAYGHYLQAWEINPGLDQVRDELVRLRKELGATGLLHTTRPALAAIYGRGGQYGRAANEWRAVIAADPSNVGAQVGLAETLWRAGEDSAAAAACGEVLCLEPDSARALAMLADIERRKGTVDRATVDRYRAVDPAGELVPLLTELRPGADLTFLLDASATVPDFDFSVAVDGGDFGGADTPPPVEATANRTSTSPASQLQAPDLWDSLVSDITGELRSPAAMYGDAALSPTVPLGGQDRDIDGEMIPFAWELPTANGMNGHGSGVAADPVLDDLEALFSNPVAEAAGSAWLTPLSGQSSTVPATADHDFTRLDLDQRDPDLKQGAGAPVDFAAAEFDTIANPGLDSSHPEPHLPPSDDADSADGSLDRVLDVSASDANLNPFVTADGRVDLTVGWDDLDRQLAEATPAGETSDFDHLVADLGLDDIVPFAASGEERPIEWEPFTSDDFTETELAVSAQEATATDGAAPVPTAAPVAVPIAPTAPEWAPLAAAAETVSTADVDALDFDALLNGGWNNIEEELASAIPAPSASGYTEMFRQMDHEVAAPFVPADQGDADVDPLANPDAVGSPLDFDDLLAVTSQDATAALMLPPSARDLDLDLDLNLKLAADADAFQPEAPRVTGQSVLADEQTFDDPFDLGGLAPFDFAETAIEFADQSTAVDFSDIGGDAAADVYELFSASAGQFDAGTDMGSDHLVAAWVDPAPMDSVPEPDALAATSGDAGPTLALDASASAAAVDAERLAEGHAEGHADGLSSSWPTSVSSTTFLSGGLGEEGNLFDRLRTAKARRRQTGATVVDRSFRRVFPLAAAAEMTPGATQSRTLAVISEAAPDQVRDESATEVSVRRTSGLSLVGRTAEVVPTLDFADLRQRLKGSTGETLEVVEMLEGALAAGAADWLVPRVLGEAYLKLGRTEDAAMQYRQAMLRRARAR